MPGAFVKAEQVVTDMVADLIRKYHPDLDTTGATFDILMAFRDEDSEEPALKLHGVRAMAIASVNKLMHRVLGLADGLIRVDGDEWPNLPHRHQLALLDHELEHFEVKRDKVGEIQWDDIDRPQLKLKPHDFDVGWFHNIADRWGVDSFEVRQFLQVSGESPYQRHLTIEPGRRFVPRNQQILEGEVSR